MSNLYVVPTGRQFAIEYLTAKQDTVAPSRMLNMSIEHRVPEWFVPSLRQVVSVPLPSLKAADFCFLRPSILAAIVAIRDQIDAHRRKILRDKPSPWFMDRSKTHCLRPGTCSSEFRQRWESIGEKMLLSDTWYSGRTILDAVTHSLSDPYDFCHECPILFEAALSKELLEEESIIGDRVTELYNSNQFMNVDGTEGGIDPNI
jgi:hypothetical protein